MPVKNRQREGPYLKLSNETIASENRILKLNLAQSGDVGENKSAEIFPSYNEPKIGKKFSCRKFPAIQYCEEYDAICCICPLQCEVELTSSLLGAVTTMAWVCKLWSSEGAAGNRPTSDVHRFLGCMNNLPACPRLTKPRGLDQTQPEEPTQSTGVQADWSPMLSHCQQCFWQCAHYALQLLSQHYPSGFPGVAGRDGDEGMPIGCGKLRPLVEEFLASLDVAGEGVAEPIECLALVLPKVRICVHFCVVVA